MASQEERSTAEEGWGKGPRGREDAGRKNRLGGGLVNHGDSEKKEVMDGAAAAAATTGFHPLLLSFALSVLP